MPSTAPGPRAHIAPAMEARRNELDLRWEDVSAAAGLSLRALQAVRKPDSTAVIRPRTMAKIDRALRWQPGSFEGLLTRHAEPVPLEGAPPTALPVPGAGSDDPDVQSVLADIAKAIKDHRTPEPTGAQAFPESEPQANLWDAATPERDQQGVIVRPPRWSKDQAVELIATLRRGGARSPGEEADRTGSQGA